MILTDKEITREMFMKGIVLSPFNKEHLNPVSYDMTLAPTCKVYHPGALHGTHRLMDLLGSDKYLEFLEWTDKIEHNENWYLDVKNKAQSVFEFEIPQTGFILQPNHLYLYSCIETIGVHHTVAASVMGKSSLGRLGLDIHVCAGFIDTGFQGSLVLEMRTIYPLKVYPGQKICQVKFERTEGVPGEVYSQKQGSKYMGQTGVQESKMGHNWNDGKDSNMMYERITG